MAFPLDPCRPEPPIPIHPRGMWWEWIARRAAALSTAKAHYAAQALGQAPGVALRFGAPFFKEFALRVPKTPAGVLRALRRRRILGGLPLGQFDRRLRDSILVAVTERRTRAEIDAYAAALAAVTG